LAIGSTRLPRPSEPWTTDASHARVIRNSFGHVVAYVASERDKKVDLAYSSDDARNQRDAEIIQTELQAAGLAATELEVRVGRGFATGEENKRPDQPIGLIPIDSIFSPVTRVKYAVENTRVGQRTDYDKLILEVWTDGRLTPDDALLQASAIIRHHLDVFVHYNEEVIEFDQTPAGVSEENIKLKKLLNMSVNEIELSVRAANCLNNANITTVGQLAQKTEAEMLKYRNFGKKSLNEIKDKLQHLGLSLGMKFETGLIDLPVSVDGAAPVAGPAAGQQ